jgi:hypothetical protein
MALGIAKTTATIISEKAPNVSACRDVYRVGILDRLAFKKLSRIDEN